MCTADMMKDRNVNGVISHVPDVVGAGQQMPAAVPRLARHTFTLTDGHKVGLAVAGRGVPLVVVHGFTAEGFLYAQTLHRLVRKGFKVVAIDMAGHGGTQGLPTGGGLLDDYADLMSRCIAELGIRKAVTAGHSMGGRVVAQLAADEPERTIATLLIDAIVGEQWDQMVKVFRIAPPLLGLLGAALMADAAATVPVVADPSQARKLGRLITPTLVGHVTQPWRLIGPGISILRSTGTGDILDTLSAESVPTFVIHGEYDLVVPICTGRAAAERSGGQLVTVKRAAHSWLLRDPEALPAIVADLLDGRLGDAIRAELPAAGADSTDEIEELLYEPDAPILALTPDHTYSDAVTEHRPPRYAWSIT
jgi:pimeloyl-ACP methyl ester carboxylesterase